MKTLAIIGGGSWGTALAVVLAPRFERVRLWFHEPDLAAAAATERENRIFLPGVRIPENVESGSRLDSAASGADLILGVMPSHAARDVYQDLRGSVAPIVSATKGLDSTDLLRMSQVIEDIFGAGFPVAVLSGPSFAREVAEGKPTALVCGSRDAALAAAVQEQFSSGTLRVYASSDPIGVELGGALKNVIAIAAGICDGLALGHNALAALVTRGLAEITRLAVACGARPETLAGLAGLGDLVLTCTSDMSRNRQVGLQLASGAGLDRILASTPMVAEGVRTAALAMKLAERHGIDMPITSEMQAIMNGHRGPGEAISRLMCRTLRSEMPGT
ncbi:MAG TPA: NAD(P)H-dependent glycerol-3-phosphate dehydrogenase [Bryobacteraceae bacterium]|nr:NAD(P)H-dependent glycerol-3-phosphate dehydrogenase [Bryobacteraceae bacterium]